MTTEEAIAWFEMGKRGLTMPGANAMYEKAIAALRAQQEAEKNEPLTLDELRNMNGEPVWCVDGSGDETWGLVDMSCGHVDVIDHDSGSWRGEFYNMRGDGKNGLHRLGWIAYRHKPKEAEAALEAWHGKNQ